MPPLDTHLWKQAVANMRGAAPSADDPAWLSDFGPLEMNGAELAVGVPSEQYLGKLSADMRQRLEQAVGQVVGQPVHIAFKLNRRGSPVERAAAPAIGLPPAPLVDEIHLRLNPNYSFENFVVGPTNRLAHAGCLAVVEAPGQAYNPLFIHSGVGLGKSHLLQATCRSIVKRRPGANIMYLSCDQFVNHFILAVQRGHIERFHHYFRHLDALVIDDIHFLAHKEQTQEEFFHTFNALYQLQKQVILSSDSAPHEIPQLEERLVSRFKWGLVCTIDRPTFETRVAIVQKKAELRGRELPEDVVRYIAMHIDTNIRELEGAIIRLIGYAALCNRPIDLALTQEALRDIVPAAKTAPSLQDIVEAVCRRYNIRLSDLQGKRRNQSTALPRQVCMYMARLLTNHSLQEIGAYFGGRDHTTVLHAERKIKELAASDSVLRAIVAAIRLELT